MGHRINASLARSSPRRWTSSANAAAQASVVPRQAGQTREHGVRLLEPDVGEFAAVSGVPS
jgi:hypothetical protein